MALRPDIVLQRSINAAIAAASNVTDDTDINVPSNTSLPGSAVIDALNAVKSAIGSGFRFTAKKNGTVFLRARFTGTLVVSESEYTLTLPATFTTEDISDTTLDGVLTARIESADGARYIEGTVGKGAADFVFVSDVVEADGVDFGSVSMSFGVSIDSAEQAYLVPVVSGGYQNDAAEYRRLFGPGTVNIDTLANLIIGVDSGTEQRGYFRFRAPASGNLTALRIYWAEGAGYANGNGGVITIEVFEDDGTAGHLPLTSSTLSTGSYGPTMSGGNFTGGAAFNDSITMTATSPLVAGRLYHIGFRNTAASPSVNNISINGSGTIENNGSGNRWLNRIDNAMLYASRTASTSDPFVFEDWTVNGHGALTYRPIMQLTIGGTAYANHAYESGNYTENNGAGQPTIWTLTTGQQFRERFTTSEAMRFSGMSVFMSFSVAGAATWSLDYGGTQYASGTITQSASNYSTQVENGITVVEHTWYDNAFTAPTVSLPAGTYYVTITVTSGTLKIATQKPGAWAYAAAWDDSQAEVNLTGSWINADHDDHTTGASQINNWPLVLHRYTQEAPDSGGGGLVNTADTVVNDMSLFNSFTLRGYESQTSGWYVRPVNMMGPVANLEHTPQWWKDGNPGRYPRTLYACLPWFVIFDGTSHSATNVRVALKNARFYILRNNGTWQSYGSWAGVHGYEYEKVNLFNQSNPENSRTLSDGSVEIKPPSNANLSWHGWASRTAIDPNDIVSVFVTIQGRLVIDNPNLTDDRASAQLGVQVGADYYIDTGTSWPFVVPAVAISRTKQLTNSWQSFNMQTFSNLALQEPGGGITEAQFRSNPPPLD